MESQRQKINFIVMYQTTSRCNLESAFHLLDCEDGGTNFCRHSDTPLPDCNKECVFIKIIFFLRRKNFRVKRRLVRCGHYSCDLSDNGTEDFHVGIVTFHRSASVKLLL